MQVSVELDIADESHGVTRPETGHLGCASVRTATANTTAPARVALSARNPAQTFPTGGSAEYGRATSIRPPIIRNGLAPPPHSQSSWADACNAGRGGGKLGRGKVRQAHARQGQVTELRMKTWLCLRQAHSSSGESSRFTRFPAGSSIPMEPFGLREDRR